MKEPRENLLKIIAVLLLIVLGLLIFGNYKLLKAKQKIFSKLQETKMDFKELSKDKELIQGKILQSQNGDYLEMVAREELNFKKSGEQVVAFPDQKEFQETEASQKIKDLWQKFMEMIKK